MQSVEAADDYRGVAQYILASEAVELGHEKYDALSNVGTIKVCLFLISEFLSNVHGP